MKTILIIMVLAVITGCASTKYKTVKVHDKRVAIPEVLRKYFINNKSKAKDWDRVKLTEAGLIRVHFSPESARFVKLCNDYGYPANVDIVEHLQRAEYGTMVHVFLDGRHTWFDFRRGKIVGRPENWRVIATLSKEKIKEIAEKN